MMGWRTNVRQTFFNASDSSTQVKMRAYNSGTLEAACGHQIACQRSADSNHQHRLENEEQHGQVVVFKTLDVGTRCCEFGQFTVFDRATKLALCTAVAFATAAIVDR